MVQIGGSDSFAIFGGMDVSSQNLWGGNVTLYYAMKVHCMSILVLMLSSHHCHN
jgi:hypothetical protein